MHIGHLSLVAFRSCRGNSPSFSNPRNSPAPSFWGLAHPELHRVRFALPLLARAPPSMMYPAPQFSKPGPAPFRVPIRPPSAPPLPPAVTEEKLPIFGPGREGAGLSTLSAEGGDPAVGGVCCCGAGRPLRD